MDGKGWGMSYRNKAILIDRDGTIIRDVHHLTRPDQVEILPGAVERIREVNDAGLVVCVVSNQSVVGRGMCSIDDVLEVHSLLDRRLRDKGAVIDSFVFCPHHPDDGCFCRKPRPGLLYQAAVRHQLDLRECLMIGDAVSDGQAAEAAGCRFYHVDKNIGLVQWDPSEFLGALGCES